MKHLPYILIIILFLIAGGAYLEFSKKETSPDLPNPFSKDSDVNSTTITPAPEIAGINGWLNSKPLLLSELRGKVVLIDFWTYSCINCIRTLPYITKWDETYKDQGLVIIGVHTPEFAFEKDTNNVQAALKKYNINYAVAQDNDYATWTAFKNQYWPAHYLIDKNGDIVYTHFGEGKYVETENKIRELLGQTAKTEDEKPEAHDVRTPEIYFGTSRLENLTSGQKVSTSPETYVIPNSIGENTFALEGTWQFSKDSARLVSGHGKIKLYFYASKVHMVAKSETAQSITIRADDSPARIIQILDPDLYTLFESDEPGPKIIEISIPESGFEAFTFTFG